MERAPADEGEFALRHYVAVLWRRKHYVVAGLVIGGLVGLLLSSNPKRSFASTSEILFEAPVSEQIFAPADQSAGGSGGPGATANATEIGVMNSRSVRDQVAEAVGDGASFTVSIAPVASSNVVAVRAESRDPARAEQVAQTYAETYISIRRDQLVTGLLEAVATVQAEITALVAEAGEFDGPLREIDEDMLVAADETERRALEVQRQEILAQREPLLSRKAAFEEEADQLRLAANLTKTGGAQIVSDASRPRRTASNDKARNVAAGVVVGSLLGAVLAFVREHFDETVKTRDELEAGTAPLPVLGVIPRFGRVQRLLRRRRVVPVVQSAPRSLAAEAYRSLRTSLGFALATSARTIQVTSPSSGDGSTTTVANLALSWARAGRCVVVIDANLRRPNLHRLFGLDNTDGISSVVQDGAPFEAVAQPVPGEPGLRVVTAGRTVLDPAELLSRQPLRDVLTAAAQYADLVLVDGPPLLPVADALVLAGSVDSVLLLARVRRTKREALDRAVDQLRQVHAPLVGTVLNGTSAREAPTSAYGDRTGPRRYLPTRRIRLNGTSSSARHPEGEPTEPATDQTQEPPATVP